MQATLQRHCHFIIAPLHDGEKPCPIQLAPDAKPDGSRSTAAAKAKAKEEYGGATPFPHVVLRAACIPESLLKTFTAAIQVC
jgi:hypothetical protein